MLDADGSWLWDATAAEAEDLCLKLHATKTGSRKWADGVKLRIPLIESQNLNKDQFAPALHENSKLTAASYGKRYIHKEHIAGEHYIFQFSGVSKKDGKTFQLKRADFNRVTLGIAS